MMMGLISPLSAAAVVSVPTAFDASDHSANITFTDSNRTVSYSGTTTDAAARCTTYKSSGQFYFEFTVNNTLTGGDAGGGIAQAGATLANIANISSLSSIVFRSGNIWSNGTNSGKALGSIATLGTIIGVAVDLTNNKIWYRIAPSGNWNGLAIGSENPATNTGGVTLVPGSGMTPAATFGGTSGTNVPNNFSFNFGQAAFNGTVPSGFTSGWMT
jgi:hypothetical protein